MVEKRVGGSSSKPSILIIYVLSLFFASTLCYTLSIQSRSWLWIFVIPGILGAIFSVFHYTKTKNYGESLFPSVFVLVISPLILYAVRELLGLLDALDQSLFIWHGLIFFYSLLVNGGILFIVAITLAIVHEVGK